MNLVDSINNLRNILFVKRSKPKDWIHHFFYLINDQKLAPMLTIVLNLPAIVTPLC